MKNLKLLTITLFALFSISIAQSKETEKKLEGLKGDVTKITIETTEGRIELTGEDAEAALSKIKKKNSSHFTFINDNGEEKEITVDIDTKDTDGEKVIIINKNIDGKETVEKYSGDEAEEFILKMKDDGDLVWISDGDAESIKKKVNVEVADGVKIVTVTTTEDGKENIEVYEGKEAEEYLKKIDGGKKVIKKKIIIQKEVEEENDGENE